VAAVAVLASQEGWSENKQGSYDHRPQMQLLWRADIHIGQQSRGHGISHQVRRRQSSGYGLISTKASGRGARQGSMVRLYNTRDGLGKKPQECHDRGPGRAMRFHYPSSVVGSAAGDGHSTRKLHALARPMGGPMGIWRSESETKLPRAWKRPARRLRARVCIMAQTRNWNWVAATCRLAVLRRESTSTEAPRTGWAALSQAKWLWRVRSAHCAGALRWCRRYRGLTRTDMGAR
jgi:hypothetical protein